VACPGCPSEVGLRLCMLRHVAALFLRDPTADALLTSAIPEDAQNVTSSFHPHPPTLGAQGVPGAPRPGVP